MKLHLLFFIPAFLLSACANIIPPTGGEKDLNPPVALYNSANTTNFKEGEIEIRFNEFVVLKNAREQFYTSPPLKETPKLTVKGKSVYLNWEEALQTEQTYLFHLGDGIADYNEGNLLPNYSFLFSTGSSLDSLSLSGTISDALTKEPKKGAFAVLYIYSVSNSDSLLYLEQPQYIAKADENGHFHFPNLKDEQYLLFALADEDRSLTFSLAEEVVGFHEEVVSPDSTTIELLLFNETSLADTLSPLFTDSLTEYGSITVDSLPNTNCILEVLKNKKVVKRLPAKKRVTIDSLPAGNYQARIIVDSNQNGKWDTGNVLKKRQPESIFYYSKEIQLRANWDLEINWKQ